MAAPAAPVRHVLSRRAGFGLRPTVLETPETSVRGTVWRFTLAGVLAVFAVAFASVFVSLRISTDQAVDEARRIAYLSGKGIVEPAVTDGLLAGDPDAIVAMDRLVRSSVLQGSLMRVKIWNADGQVLYSDETRLIGERFDLDEEAEAALSRQTVFGGVSDLSAPENIYEVGGELLEVYLPIATPSGERLLYEAYFRVDGVKEAGRQIWRDFAPVTLGGLIALEVIQIPIAWSLARRVRRSQRERERLLRSSLEASDTERRRIASDLHDGVVQDLTGVSFELAAASRRGEGGELTGQAAAKVRESVRSLRSLLVEIYPPNLGSEGLEAALTDLLARPSVRGMETSLDVDVHENDLSPTVAALVYRTTQEALRNVVKHSGAGAVSVTLTAEAERLRLVIEDDGHGFDVEKLGTMPGTGHVGLRLLADLVADLGGSLTVESAQGQGTRLTLEIGGGS